MAAHRNGAWRSVLLAQALLLSTVLHAQPEADRALRIPESLQPAIAAAEQTGRTLQRLDRAARIATDALQADKAARKVRKAVRGWITDGIDTGTRVSFLDQSDPPANAYQVIVESSGRIASAAVPIDPALDERQQALVRARRAALARPFMPCARSYNSVAFRSGDEIHVYLMPGRTRDDVHPAGGFHRMVYDATGRTFLSERAFSRSCLELGGKTPSGQTAALMVSHVLDPQPTEIHVFISLDAGMPLYVATTSNGHLWKVEAGAVSLVADRVGAGAG